MRGLPETDENVGKRVRHEKMVADSQRQLDNIEREEDRAKVEHALAHEAYHKAREGRDRRWLTHCDDKPVTATCDHCAAVERGEKPAIVPASPQPRPVLADIPTGLTCPQSGCGGEVRIRRSNGEMACTLSGHVYQKEEVLMNTYKLMERLAKGQI